MSSAVVEGVGDAVDAVGQRISMSAIIDTIKSGIGGVFEIAGQAFDFLIDNPLCALMLVTGFAYTGLSLVKRGLRIAKGR